MPSHLHRHALQTALRIEHSAYCDALVSVTHFKITILEGEVGRSMNARHLRPSLLQAAGFRIVEAYSSKTGEMDPVIARFEPRRTF
jgi:hypothetical protein